MGQRGADVRAVLLEAVVELDEVLGSRGEFDVRGVFHLAEGDHHPGVRQPQVPHHRAGDPLRPQMQVLGLVEGHIDGSTLVAKVLTVSYDRRLNSAWTAARTVSRWGYPCSISLPPVVTRPLYGGPGRSGMGRTGPVGQGSWLDAHPCHPDRAAPHNPGRSTDSSPTGSGRLTACCRPSTHFLGGHVRLRCWHGLVSDVQPPTKGSPLRSYRKLLKRTTAVGAIALAAFSLQPGSAAAAPAPRPVRLPHQRRRRHPRRHRVNSPSWSGCRWAAAAPSTPRTSSSPRRTASTAAATTPPSPPPRAWSTWRTPAPSRSSPPRSSRPPATTARARTGR